MTKLLFFSGSVRKGSLNKKLAALACTLAQDAGAEATLIDLRDFSMPFYDGDLESESGLPENAKKLKMIFADHDGFFIASPEYNSSFSPLLKNTIDWLSRPHMENEPPMIAFKGKVAALGAASPSWRGGLRGLVPLRMLLDNIGVFVVPEQTTVTGAHTAFDDNGGFKDDTQARSLKATVDQFVQTASRLRA